jgi:hypothetical protein
MTGIVRMLRMVMFIILFDLVYDFIVSPKTGLLYALKAATSSWCIGW